MNWKILMCLVICASMEQASCARILRDTLYPTDASLNTDRATLEEGPGYSTYGHVQMEAARQRRIAPLVDTINEEDKYGNDGGHVRVAANSFLDMFEDKSGSFSESLGQPSNRTVNLLAGLNPALAELGDKLGGIA